MIEVFADVWCPFAHVGLRRTVRRRDQLGRHDVAVRVRAWPLELVNGEPLDAESTAEHVDALRLQVAPDLFAGFDPDRFPSTSLPALALAAAAYRRGDRTGEAVSLTLRTALFEEGRDISSADVLADVARTHGIGETGSEDDQNVRAEWREGVARGVKGSPHFFCGVTDAFCPALDISKDEAGALQLRSNAHVLDVFLADCFGEGPD